MIEGLQGVGIFMTAIVGILLAIFLVMGLVKNYRIWHIVVVAFVFAFMLTLWLVPLFNVSSQSGTYELVNYSETSDGDYLIIYVHDNVTETREISSDDISFVDSHDSNSTVSVKVERGHSLLGVVCEEDYAVIRTS